jgi:hypothetical protein
MKILIIGFLAFFGWSALSTHLYVCKIKGLCDEPMTMQTQVTDNKDIIAGNISGKPLAPEQATSPENFQYTLHLTNPGLTLIQ